MKRWECKMLDDSCDACVALHGQAVGDYAYPPHSDCAAKGGCKCRTVVPAIARVITFNDHVTMGWRDRLRSLFGKPVEVTASLTVGAFDGESNLLVGFQEISTG